MFTQTITSFISIKSVVSTMICSEVLRIHPIFTIFGFVTYWLILRCAAALAFVLTICISYQWLRSTAPCLGRSEHPRKKATTLKLLSIFMTIWASMYSPYVAYLGLEYVLSFGILGWFPALLPVDCASEICRVSGDTACRIRAQ